MSDHNRHVQRPAAVVDKQRPLLRAHKRAFLLLAFYIPLVLIPWIITVILNYRPLTKSSWTYAPGFTYKEYKLIQGWAKAIPIMNAVAAILAIPITSSIIAQAAVVFAQRRRSGQQLSVRHLFNLADRAWCDLGMIHDLLWSWEAGSVSVSRFVLAGAALVVLGAVQYPLFQLLAPWEEITIPSCQDTSYVREPGYRITNCEFNPRLSEGYSQIGIDLEPAQMAVVPAPYMMSRIIRDLSTISSRDTQPYLWQEIDNETGLGNPARIDSSDNSGFVAALRADTTTGVLREHIMRLNSSLSCNNLTASEYPSTCSGSNPFQASFDYASDYYTSFNMTVDICVPGDVAKYPWTLSRNRQELSEELFLKYTRTTSRDERDDGVLHCTAQTTRGYFELGNTHNRGVHGPLLEKWPSAGPPLDDYQFNDFFKSEYGDEGYKPGYIPSEEDNIRGGARPTPDPRTNYDSPLVFTNMSGPLMTSVLALFGTDSWTHSVSNLTIGKDDDALEASNSDQLALIEPLCERIPFARESYSAQTDSDKRHCLSGGLRGLHTASRGLLYGWTDKDAAEYRLRVAMFLSNQAILTTASTRLLPWSEDVGREIYTAPGATVRKPSIALPSQIILSIIVAVHVTGLLWVGCCIYMWPAWTRTLDSMAIARVAASLDPGLLPPFQTTGQGERQKLAPVDGLVGVQEREDAVELHPGGDRVRRRERGRAVDSEIEMETLSIASTVGKEPTSSAAPVPLINSTRVTLGLGAPGLITRRGQKLASPSSRQGAAVV